MNNMKKTQLGRIGFWISLAPWVLVLCSMIGFPGFS